MGELFGLEDDPDCPNRVYQGECLAVNAHACVLLASLQRTMCTQAPQPCQWARAVARYNINTRNLQEAWVLVRRTSIKRMHPSLQGIMIMEKWKPETTLSWSGRCPVGKFRQVGAGVQ